MLILIKRLAVSDEYIRHEEKWQYLTPETKK